MLHREKLILYSTFWFLSLNIIAYIVLLLMEGFRVLPSWLNGVAEWLGLLSVIMMVMRTVYVVVVLTRWSMERERALHVELKTIAERLHDEQVNTQHEILP